MIERRNEILELSFEFALGIITYCEILEGKKKYVIARQLLKSGTSIGANVREAQNPHSRADFISKLVKQLRMRMKLNIGFCYVRRAEITLILKSF